MLNHFSIFQLFYMGKGRIWNISCGNKRSSNSCCEQGEFGDLLKAVILNDNKVLSTDPAIFLKSTSHCKNQHSERQIIHTFQQPRILYFYLSSGFLSLLMICCSFTHAVNSATRASLQDNSSLAPPAPNSSFCHPTCVSDSCASLTLQAGQGTGLDLKSGLI